MNRIAHILAVTITSLFVTTVAASGQQQRIVRGPVDDADVVRSEAGAHPAAFAKLDRGRVNPQTRMTGLVLNLALRPGAEQELDAFIVKQQDPSSPQFHQWLTPDEFERRFGIADDDLAVIVDWLTSHGVTIDQVGSGRRSIHFSGSVGQVEQTFHTEIHEYLVDGRLHHANATPPALPRVLSSAVQSLAALDDFAPRRNSNIPGSRSTHTLAPEDFAKIYNTKALRNLGFDGTGVSIAVVGESDFNVADVNQFRSTFGLPANPPTKVLVDGAGSPCVYPCVIPTDVNDGEWEALLDVEWAGAVAPKARILYVAATSYVYYCSPTGCVIGSQPPSSSIATNKVGIAAQYAVSRKIAPIISVSLGKCEADNGSGDYTFFNNLWQQAASYGISVFVASGDAGAGGCGSADASSEPLSLFSANLICTSAYVTCVGGSQFNDGPGTWAASSDPVDKSSVLPGTSGTYYIPELAWNESAAVSGGRGLWASGGGPSRFSPQPGYQQYSFTTVLPGIPWLQVIGMPLDGVRHTPDVSLNAASHTPYLLVRHGAMTSIAGTSAATPAFAALMAIFEHANGQWWGCFNNVLYPLANKQYWGLTPQVFHDITAGNNFTVYGYLTIPNVVYSFPQSTGYNAGRGYDQATGLGSIDAYLLTYYWWLAFQ